MPSVEVANARLLQVGRGGGTDTFESEAGAPASIWDGDVGVFFDEIRDRRTRDGSSDVYVRRELIVSADLRAADGSLLEWREGDTVTFRRRRATTTLTGRVQLVDGAEAPAGTGGEVRLLLELT